MAEEVVTMESLFETVSTMSQGLDVFYLIFAVSIQ